MQKKKFTFHVDLDMFTPASDKEKEYLVQMRPSSTFFKDGVKRFCKNKVALVSLIVIVIITIASIVIPIFWPYSYETQLGVQPGKIVDASFNNLKPMEYGTTEQELIEACKQANIYEFIEKQENGLDTVVGNRGLKLSGGEKQRISIARVLLKDPALMIFDEATSALDSISEQKIQDAIEPLISSRTSILIAHRLSTILAADEILVIKDGVISERGTHSELVNRGGVYSELYKTQFSKAESGTERFEYTEGEDSTE